MRTQPDVLPMSSRTFAKDAASTSLFFRGRFDLFWTMSGARVGQKLDADEFFSMKMRHTSSLTRVSCLHEGLNEYLMVEYEIGR